MNSIVASILAIDVGEKRIGVAVAGLTSRLAQPLCTIYAHDGSSQEIAELAHRQSARAIIVGLPRNMDGKETAQTALVKKFADTLRATTDLPLYFQDETLTSVEARTELELRGLPYNKEDVDKLAACHILTDWLAAHP